MVREWRQEKKKKRLDRKRIAHGICIPTNNNQDDVDMNCSPVLSEENGSPTEDEKISKDNEKENNDGGEKTNTESDARDRKKRDRKERKRRANATIPCRFYHSKSGCWRGDKCMFLHSDSVNGEDKATNYSNTRDVNSTNETEMDIDMIDDLSNQIRTKARVSVPVKISFGRRRR